MSTKQTQLQSELDDFMSGVDTGVAPETDVNADADANDSAETADAQLDADADADANTDTDANAEGETDAGDASNAGDEDELATLRKQNELLIAQLNVATLAQHKNENNVSGDAQLVADPSDETLFGDWKFDEIIENEDAFKKFLGDFAKRIMTTTEERMLQKLPTTVSKLTMEQIEARNTVTTFYDTHKQLAAVKPFVAKIVTTVASEHADWDLPQVLEESANRAYKALGLKSQAELADATNVPRKPAFVGPARGKRGAQQDANKTKLEKELEELMEL